MNSTINSRKEKFLTFERENSSNGYLNVKEDFNLLGNLKSELRDLEKKLYNYEVNIKDEDMLYIKENGINNNTMFLDTQYSKSKEVNDKNIAQYLKIIERDTSPISPLKDPIKRHIHRNNKSYTNPEIEYLNDSKFIVNETKQHTEKPFLRKTTTLNKEKSKSTSQYLSPTNFTHSNNYIKANSWRSGEALVKKYFNKIKNENNLNDSRDEIMQTSKEDKSLESFLNTHELKELKKTKDTNTKYTHSNLRKPTKSSNSETITESNIPQKKTNEKKYSKNDILEFIESKKKKRMNEVNYEREKIRKDQNEKRQKLEELYRKQRENASLSYKINDKKHIDQNNFDTNILKRRHEESLPQYLEEKIKNLLDDNDKLIKKRYQEFQSSKITNKYSDMNLSENNSEINVSRHSYREIDKLNDNENDMFISNKHDRLKKICNMSLDLQTQLQKFKVNLLSIADNNQLNLNNETKPQKFDNSIETAVANKAELLSFNQEKQNDQRISKENFQIYEHLESLPGTNNIKSNGYNFDDIYPTRIETTSSLYHIESFNIVQTQSVLYDELANNMSKTNNVSNLEKQYPDDDYNFIKVFRKKLKYDKLEKPNLYEEDNKDYSEDFTKLNESRAQSENRKEKLNDSIISSVTTASDKLLNSSNSYKKIEHEESEAIEKSTQKNDKKVTENIEVFDNSDDEITEQILSNKENINDRPAEIEIENINNLKDQTIDIEESSHDSTLHRSLLENKIENKHSTKSTYKQVQDKEERYSPTSLERLLNAGINYLDVLNYSAVQLEELDKVRCIGLAQQESVALAHLLKEQQLEKEIMILQEKSKRDLMESIELREKFKISKKSSNRPDTGTYNTSFTSEDKKYKKDDHSTFSSSSISSSEATENNTKNKSVTIQTSKTNPKTASIKTLENTIIDSSTTPLDDKTTLNVTKNTKQYRYNDESIKTEISQKHSTDQLNSKQEIQTETNLSAKDSKHINKSEIESVTSDFSENSENYSKPVSKLSDHTSRYDKKTSRLKFDDSFKNFMDELSNKYMKEEDLRSKHQAQLLKLREKALIEKTKAELIWLDQMKKQTAKKVDEKMPSFNEKKKILLKKLEQEQENIKKIKEAQKKSTYNRLKALSKHQKLVQLYQQKLEKEASGNLEELNDTLDKGMLSSLSQQTEGSEEDISDSALKSESSKSEKFNPELLLTKREKDLISRKKRAEELIAWNKRLDEEEKKLKEMEKSAALVMVNSEKELISRKDNKETNQKLENTNSLDYDIDTDSNMHISTRITESIKTEIKDSNQSLKKEHKFDKNLKAKQDVESKDNDETLSNISSDKNIESSDLESKIKILEAELHRKKSEAMKLQKQKKRNILKQKENELKVKIQSYNEIINKIKEEKPPALSFVENKVKEKQSQIQKKKVDNESSAQINSIRTETFETDTSSFSEKSEENEKKNSNVKQIIKSFNENDKKRQAQTSSPSSISEKSSLKPVFNAATQQNDKYDDDFTSEDNKSLSNINVETEQDKQTEKSYDEDQNTISEISENIDLNNKEHDDESNESSSTDTQILNLGVQSKNIETVNSNEAKENETIEEFSVQTFQDIPSIQDSFDRNISNIIDEAVENFENLKKTLPDTPEQTETTMSNKSEHNDQAAHSIQDSLFEQAISQILIIRNTKVNRENSKKLDEETITNTKINGEYIEKLDEEENNENNEIETEKETLNENQDIFEKVYQSPIIEPAHVPLINLEQIDENPKKIDGLSFLNIKNVNSLYDKEKLEKLTNFAVEKIYWPLVLKKLPLISLDNIQRNEFINFLKEESETKIKQVKSGENNNEIEKAELSFKEMILDLIGELIQDLYREVYEPQNLITDFMPKVYHSVRKTHFKTIKQGPNDLFHTKKIILSKLFKILKLDSKNETEKKSKWRSQKRLDLVDGLLDTEMRDDEHEWCSYEEEELETKLAMSDAICDLLLMDTIETIRSKIK